LNAQSIDWAFSFVLPKFCDKIVANLLGA
jgi:hypothetical protein